MVMPTYFIFAKQKLSFPQESCFSSFSKIFDFVKNGVTNSDLFCLFGGDKRARISLWLMTLALCRQAASSGTGSFFFLIARDKRVSERVNPPLCALRSQSLFASKLKSGFLPKGASQSALPIAIPV